MRKFLKKLICVLSATVMGASLFSASACGSVYKSGKLEGSTEGTVVSNGGFAVQKGDFIYYINGKQSNSADNTYGKVETGAIMRISSTDLKERNYANAETVVSEIAYSGNSNAGIFVYGDYVYYSTPSAEKNSDGEIQYSDLVFKRARLDGSEVMKGYFAKYSNSSVEYRFVKGDDDVVYLLYVATSEDLYGKAYTNLHSVNTETGVDTLLAYNVDSVTFDKTNLENPRVFYTMKVTNFTTSTTANTTYNQVYTVTADETEKNEYDFSYLDDYDAEKDPLYVNCGDLVLDGIGWVDGHLDLTQFNDKGLVNGGILPAKRNPYTYSLSTYQNGTLFYTRTSEYVTTPVLFKVGVDELLDANHSPALDNPEVDKCLHIDGSNASTYSYIFENDALTGAFVLSSNGLIKTTVKDGALLTEVDNENTFYLTTGGTPTILFTGTHEEDGKTYSDVYYSESGSGAKGYIIKRVSYDGEYADYNKMPEGELVNAYTPVRILDLDCSTDWYKPEMFGGRIFFSTQTTTMTEYSNSTTSYTHIMVCDINGENGVMSNKELKEFNDKYEGISEIIDEVDADTYANLANAYRYGFYTGDAKYLDKLIKAYVDIGEDEEKFWSKESVEKFNQFISCEGDWEDYAYTLKVNGQYVFANRQAYYYNLLGKMTDKNLEEYETYVRNTYLKVWPEKEEGWFEGLSTGAKVGFLIGVIGGGLLLIGAGVVVTLVIIKKRKAKLPTYTKKRVKVDTTDDKSVDVYATEDSEDKTEE